MATVAERETGHLMTNKKFYYFCRQNPTYKCVLLLCIGLPALLGTVGCKRKAATEDVVTIRTIESSLQTIGGRATVEKYLFDTSEHHQPALARIKAGGKDWVALGVRMLQYSDAGSTEGLFSALGEAMQHQPENVLPYLNQPFAKPYVDPVNGTIPHLLTPQDICLPFISGEIPYAEQLAVVLRTKTALLTVHNPSLRSQCDACLREVEESERIIRKNIAEGKNPLE